MSDGPLISTFTVRLDSKRRPTLPAALLDEAGLAGATDLVARADGPGRIVLEDPTSMLRSLQQRLTDALRESPTSPSMAVDSLFATRDADTSMDR